MIFAPPAKLPAGQLRGEDLNRLITIVGNVLPDVATDRKLMVQTAFADVPADMQGLMVKKIIWAGDQDAVATAVVYKCKDNFPVHGRNGLSYLIRSLISNTGNVYDRDWLNGLFVRYALEEVVSEQLLPDNEWSQGGLQKSDYEVIVNENTLQPVSFLQSALATAASVVHIEGPRGMGTGFLVADDLIMTCNHVIGDSTDLDRTIVSFNYQFLPDQTLMPTINAVPDPKGRFSTSPSADLDFTVFAFHRDKLPNKQLPDGALPLRFRAERAALRQRVSIIQHPCGGPKMFSMRNNLVQYADNRILQYMTSTMRGSSGSPVMNDRFEVLGVHNKGSRKLDEPVTGAKFARNQGSSAVAILGDLKTNAPDIYSRLNIVP